MNLDPNDDVDASLPAEAVDPIDLEEGDRVRVDSVGGGRIVLGDVEEVKTQAGRVAVTIVDDDGEGCVCWEELGRTWTRFPSVGEDTEGDQ